MELSSKDFNSSVKAAPSGPVGAKPGGSGAGQGGLTVAAWCEASVCADTTAAAGVVQGAQHQRGAADHRSNAAAFLHGVEDAGQ